MSPFVTTTTTTYVPYPHLLFQVGENLVQHLSQLAAAGQEFEGKKVMGHYGLDVIASCGFGVESNSFAEPDSEFNRMATRMMNPSSFRLIQALACTLMPNLGRSK